MHFKLLVRNKKIKKAFDSVHRGKMLKILEAYGIPVKIVELIRLMYENSNSNSTMFTVYTEGVS